MTEDYSRDVVVVQFFIRFVVKKAFRQSAPGCNRNRRQHVLAGYVSDCVDAVDGTVLVFVDDDEFFVADFHIGRFDV